MISWLPENVHEPLPVAFSWTSIVTVLNPVTTLANVRLAVLLPVGVRTAVPVSALSPLMSIVKLPSEMLRAFSGSLISWLSLSSSEQLVNPAHTSSRHSDIRNRFVNTFIVLFVKGCRSKMIEIYDTNIQRIGLSKLRKWFFADF